MPPLKINGAALPIIFQIMVAQIIAVDQIAGLVHMQVSFRHWWNDPRLAWNPSDYHNITKIRLPINREQGGVWTPDFAVYECADGYMYDKINTEGLAQVNYTGDVYWSTIGQLSVSHDFQLGNYPYDVQKVDITVESWAYTAE